MLVSELRLPALELERQAFHKLLFELSLVGQYKEVAVVTFLGAKGDVDINTDLIRRRGRNGREGALVDGFTSRRRRDR